MVSLARTAKRAISLLDLTNLNDRCTAADIADLCRRARTPRGDPAAVCIWPQWIGDAARHLKGSSIRIATVVNLPAGGTNAAKVRKEIEAALLAGADEIDAVIPYRAILAGEPETAKAV